MNPNRSRTPPLRNISITAAISITLAVCAVLLYRYSTDDQSSLTVEEQLELLQGEDLSPERVQELVELAEAFCRLDDQILEAIWQRLEPEQFKFQDFVFSTQCPQRSTLYGLNTGRIVTQEAARANTETDPTSNVIQEPVQDGNSLNN